MHGATILRREHASPRPGTVIEFPDGLIGYAGARRFELKRWGPEDLPFSLLVSADADGLELLVTPPAVFFPDYSFELDAKTMANVGIRSTDDAMVLVLVTVPASTQDATANLRRPLVINRRTSVGAQAVLSRTHYVTRHRLVSG